MTEIRHFTASAVVFDYADRVLLVHHNKIGLWLYPGGHVDPNEDPAQAAVREVREEAGIDVEIITEEPFRHPAVGSVASPFTIITMPVTDRKVGAHEHIDMVYVCRALTTEVTHQAEEVGGCTWVAVADIAALATPPELPSLIAEAAVFARTHA
ncbi:NUDIX domain-containing protein [Phytohabitans flavus]|uniref:DNA mismatch repair protein MutT n=1 Tax=Phytohabitans flavus TaxID=1076124 RepID=A0A6F8Y5H6_9ACTN|nr:NUDIX domain-containing protein [Phytohabitans flavus]BCB81211.1 DNA mismatch repair protein MutT [Phytohabitans flavus]